MKDPVTIDTHELNRLRECEAAWQAVFMALQHGNRDCFSGPNCSGISGVQCAVREIKRLQGLRVPVAVQWERGDDTPLQA